MWARFTRSLESLSGRRARRPLLWAAAAAAAGTLAGLRLPGTWSVWLAALAAVLTCVTLLARPKGAALAVFLSAAVVLLFAARTASVYDTPLPPEGNYTAEGIVLQEPVIRDNGGHISVHLRDVTVWNEAGDTWRLDGLYWTAYPGQDPELPVPGALIRVPGRLYTATGQRNPYGFDYRLYLRQNHLSAGFYNSGGFETVEETPKGIRPAVIRVRGFLLSRLDQAFGEHSALPKALLLGKRQVLSEDDRAAFAQLGIMHVLAVSGLHVSLLVAALSLALRRFLSGRKQLWAFAAFLLLYVLLLHGRASVLRASILTFAYLFLRSRGRNGDPLSVLSLAFMVILLLSPMDLLNAGFQLSFAAAVGIVLLFRPVSRVTEKVLGRKAGGLLASTVSAVAGTALPSIETFHRFSVAGFVFSPLVCALLAFLLPLCLAVLLVSLVWVDAAKWLALPVGWALQLMSDGVSAAAQWPYMSFNCPLIPRSFWPLIVAAIVLFSAYASRSWKGRRRLAVLAALFVLGSAVHLCTLDNGLAYVQLDEGSADCAVIQDGRHTTVVDCGEDGRDLSAYLLATGRRVDTLVLTHLHTDHCLGAQALMDARIPIGHLVIPEGADRAAVSGEALLLLDRLRKYCGTVTAAAAGDGWQTEHARVRVLWPEHGGVRSGRDANDYCLCLEYRLGDTTLLLTGDLTGAYEPYVRAQADVLKVAHHGSRSSTTEAFLAAVAPKTAIIPVSATSEAAGPEGTVRARLDKAGVHTYTTAQWGAVRIEITKDGYRIIPFIREGEDP